jgi:hypothetical protein
MLGLCTQVDHEVIDRIMIRSVRLMLEGHCVAHPTATRMTVTLNGDWDDSLEQLFTTDLHWLMHGQEVGELTILGQPIRLPNLSGGAAVYLEQDDVDEIRAAFAAGTAAGLEGLVNFLREMGLTPELLTELRAAAKADEAQSDGPSRWTRVRALLARVATDAGTEAIGGAVATAAVAFLGG